MQAKRTRSILWAALLAGTFLVAQCPKADAQQKANSPRDPNQSPAALPRPKSKASQTYPAAQIKAGELRFGAQCGFCHGRDAAGGESAPDLTRSELVAEDVRGDRLGPLIRTGRVDAGMPAFKLDDSELNSIVAFVHNQMDKFATLSGGRRSVEPADLATGNAADGRAYFNGAGGCSGCHSATGDLAGIANRYRGLALLQRMLYPSGQSDASPREDMSRLTSGQMAHFVQLGAYTDAAMHNVYAYLDTLR
jgi:cytochrome c oxidase cbb3-type subunit III